MTVIKLRRGKYNGWPGFLSETITVDGNKLPRRYKHHIVAKDGLPIRESKAIHVACQCERFKFFWEVALNVRGAADIILSNGEMPVITNPRLLVSGCKHLLAVCHDIVRQRL